jgi:hypothetical protein
MPVLMDSFFSANAQFIVCFLGKMVCREEKLLFLSFLLFNWQAAAGQEVDTIE